MKTCNVSLYPCPYKKEGTSAYIECLYNDFCDFQLPRDSRGKDLSNKFINLCPVCGALLLEIQKNRDSREKEEDRTKLLPGTGHFVTDGTDNSTAGNACPVHGAKR